MAEEGGGILGHLQHCHLPLAGPLGLLQVVPCRGKQEGAVLAVGPILSVPRADMGVEEAAYLVVPQEGKAGRHEVATVEGKEDENT